MTLKFEQGCRMTLTPKLLKVSFFGGGWHRDHGWPLVFDLGSVWGSGLRFFHLWSCWSCWAPVMWLRERAWCLAEFASSPIIGSKHRRITWKLHALPQTGEPVSCSFMQFLSFKNGLEEENDAHWHCCQPGRSLDGKLVEFWWFSSRSMSIRCFLGPEL